MHSLRRLITISTLVATTLIVSAGAIAATKSPVLDRVVKNGELRVGMSGDQPPFNAKSRSGSLIGLEVDLARRLAVAMGVELQIVTKPFGQLLGALENGDVDIVMSGMAITLQRTQNFAFVGPYMMSGKSILTKSETLAAARQASEINTANIKLAALDNSTSEQFVQRFMPKTQLVTVTDYDQGIKMILGGEVDAMVADMPICVLSVLRYPNEGMTTLTRPMTIEPIGIALPANDPQFLNLMKNYLDAMEATGVLAELRKKWLEDGSWIAALP